MIRLAYSNPSNLETELLSSLGYCNTIHRAELKLLLEHGYENYF